MNLEFELSQISHLEGGELERILTPHIGHRAAKALRELWEHNPPGELWCDDCENEIELDITVIRCNDCKNNAEDAVEKEIRADIKNNRFCGVCHTQIPVESNVVVRCNPCEMKMLKKIP